MKKQLPSRPNLEQLKNQAKTILRGHRAANLQILKQIKEHHPRFRKSSEAAIRSAPFTLSDAQLVIAQEYGFERWARLKAHVLLHQNKPSSEASVNSLRDAAARGDLTQLTELLDADPAMINEQSGRGVRTALHEAVAGGHEAVVKLLLERGADP